MFLIDLIGWAGTILLAISAIPQLITTIRSKTTDGLSFGMLLCWSLGCGSMGVYSLFMAPKLPLLVNYGLNTALTVLIMFFYFKYRKK